MFLGSGFIYLVDLHGGLLVLTSGLDFIFVKSLEFELKLKEQGYYRLVCDLAM